MFRLFSRLENGLNPMATIVQNFISTKGNDVINQRQARLDSGEKDKNDDRKFVKALIALHEKYLGVVTSDFSGHFSFKRLSRMPLWKSSTWMSATFPVPN